MKEGAVFIGQIYDVRTKRDGGGRVSIDFGRDALEEIQWAQKVAAAQGCNFQVALVPVPHTGNVWPTESPDEVVDENGEVHLR